MDILDFARSLPLGAVRSLRRYPHGLHNETYLLETSRGRFSLRIYNYKKPDQIRFELAVLARLSKLPVPHPVKLRHDLIERHNGKYAIAYRYLPGEHLTKFTKGQLREVGRFIAEYHNAERGFAWNGRRYQFYNLPDWKIEKFTRISHAAKLKHLEFLPEIVKGLKESRLSRSLPRGPIHVDIKPENVLFHEGRLSGVLDFDNAFMGPFVLDLAKSMAWFGTRDRKFHMDDALEIYRGYTERRRLHPEERESMHKALRFAFLSHVFVDYYMRAINATTEEYFEFIINDLYAAYKTIEVDEEGFNRLTRAASPPSRPRRRRAGSP